MALPLPVACLIDDCQIAGGLNIRRAAPPAQNVYGGWDRQAYATIRISPIAVHNLTGRDLDQLPEADRNSEAIRVYTKVRLFVADGGQAADVVEYQGRLWRVTQVLDYSLQGAVYVSTATLQDVQQPE
jgi:hypothetical protein